ncbi:MAG: DUF1080 domain-containing protein [Actinobacteria bacterium]|nr:MAG: DUF1080 domain-containing protein [Actinomycetota bacterium]
MYRRLIGFVLFFVALAIPLAPSAGALGAALLSDGFDGYPGNVSWLDGTGHGNWNAVYNGYGVTRVVSERGNSVLQEKPKSSTSAGETHAGLVRTLAPFGDSDTTVLMKTVSQLRTPTPNAWEVGWVLWHYTDDSHFYYFVPKPNGWELGKEDPAYPGAQRFLATGSNPTFPVGRWYTVRIRQVSNAITVWVNGAQVASFTDTQGPYLSGSLGLYNEDSQVRFDGVTVSAP